MQSAVLAIANPSVCPSICLSVTRWHWVKMTHATIIWSSLEGSSMTLSFLRVNFTANSNGNIASGVAERERVGKICNFQPISQFSANISETVKIGPRVLWWTNRKLHMRFWLVQNQWPRMTLNGRYALCCRKIRVLEPTAKMWMKVVLYCQRQKCRPVTLVSRNVRLREFLGEGRQMVVDNNNFWRLFYVETWKLGMPALLYGDKQSLGCF